ncbi:MAG: hypothetical protein KAT85_02560, partial [candidate division Zixibacteria bacterium]|nr:hypothetical protein [candidate division Zixibacteria bacterium]
MDYNLSFFGKWSKKSLTRVISYHMLYLIAADRKAHLSTSTTTHSLQPGRNRDAISDVERAVIESATDNSNAIVEKQLDEKLGVVADAMGGHVLTCLGPIMTPMDGLIRAAVEAMKTTRRKGRKIAVILETTGGYIEVAERIAHVLRSHYIQVDFIVPNMAMSA